MQMHTYIVHFLVFTKLVLVVHVSLSYHRVLLLSIMLPSAQRGLRSLANTEYILHNNRLKKHFVQLSLANWTQKHRTCSFIYGVVLQCC